MAEISTILTRERVAKNRLPHSPVQDPITRAARSVVDAIPSGNRNKLLEAMRGMKIAKSGVGR